ncbi:MAG: SPFH domain-containing protein [Oscillospiraceae bacterium]|jgi:membrane protease subunit (stomatin/prohibitin family)|nr:SPFH domain-containing protein [Oscillospiraceae bacterium]
MGLLKAGLGALGGVMADQWREYFYCESMEADVLAVKGKKRTTGRGVNVKGEDNIISNGSIVAVNEGQCMLITDQGKVVELCVEAGEFVWDASTEPSLLGGGSFGTNLIETFKTVGKRFTFGGDTGKDQRVYFFNTKELMGNKYGTPNPVPFRLVDNNIKLDVDIHIRCHGEYSYRITNPLLFYVNVCGNVQEVFRRTKIESQLKSELMTALQPALAKLSAMGIRYSELPAHTMEIANALNEILSQKWSLLRGLSVVSFGVDSVTVSDEDAQMIKTLQQNAVFRDPTMAAAHLVNAQAQAMQSAAKNESQGPLLAFAGMNMAQSVGGASPQNLFAMGQQQQPPPGYPPVPGAPQPPPGYPPQPGYPPAPGYAPPPVQAPPVQQGYAPPVQTPPVPPQAAAPAAGAAGWTCACGTAANQGKFCRECGAPKPPSAPTADGWTCACGTLNKGKFCAECGARKPAGAPTYRCDKCGWEPEDPFKAPKFCPECGDVFDENDVVGR